jgi:mRNA interferase YafQ
MKFKPRKSFDNDLKRLAKLDSTIVQEVREAIELLLENRSLPEEYADHPLDKRWAGYNEFHLRDPEHGETPSEINDVLVVYTWDFDELVLVGVRLGSHANLFKGMDSKRR